MLREFQTDCGGNSKEKADSSIIKDFNKIISDDKVFYNLFFIRSKDEITPEIEKIMGKMNIILKEIQSFIDMNLGNDKHLKDIGFFDYLNILLKKIDIGNVNNIKIVLDIFTLCKDTGITFSKALSLMKGSKNKKSEEAPALSYVPGNKHESTLYTSGICDLNYLNEIFNILKTTKFEELINSLKEKNIPNVQEKIKSLESYKENICSKMNKIFSLDLDKISEDDRKFITDNEDRIKALIDLNDNLVNFQILYNKIIPIIKNDKKWWRKNNNNEIHWKVSVAENLSPELLESIKNIPTLEIKKSDADKVMDSMVAISIEVNNYLNKINHLIETLPPEYSEKLLNELGDKKDAKLIIEKSVFDHMTGNSTMYKAEEILPIDSEKAINALLEDQSNLNNYLKDILKNLSDSITPEIVDFVVKQFSKRVHAKMCKFIEEKYKEQFSSIKNEMDRNKAIIAVINSALWRDYFILNIGELLTSDDRKINKIEIIKDVFRSDEVKDKVLYFRGKKDRKLLDIFLETKDVNHAILKSYGNLKALTEGIENENLKEMINNLKIYNPETTQVKECWIDIERPDSVKRDKEVDKIINEIDNMWKELELSEKNKNEIQISWS